MPNPKTSVAGIHPRLQRWFKSGKLNYAQMQRIQDLLRHRIVSPQNFEMLLGAKYTPHTLAVFARQILGGTYHPSELVRKGLNAQSPTVPQGHVRYVLNAKKGFFGPALEGLRRGYPQMPDTLWFSLIRRRVMESACDRRLKKVVLKLCQNRHDVEHAFHAMVRKGEPEGKIRLALKELEEIKGEMREIAVYL